MVYKVFIMLKRKAGVTPEQYKNQLENKHVPQFRELSGDDFPISHARQYLTLTEDGTTKSLNGNGTLVTFDSITVAIYEDRAHFERLMTKLKEPETYKKLMDSEGGVLDHSKTLMVEEDQCYETRR